MDKQRMAEALEQHSKNIRGVFAGSDRVGLLEVSYPDLVGDPAREIEKIASFLGDRFTPGQAVTACVKPGLHRQRGSGSLEPNAKELAQASAGRRATAILFTLENAEHFAAKNARNA
jgi:hypothetical protein